MPRLSAVQLCAKNFVHRRVRIVLTICDFRSASAASAHRLILRALEQALHQAQFQQFDQPLLPAIRFPGARRSAAASACCAETFDARAPIPQCLCSPWRWCASPAAASRCVPGASCQASPAICCFKRSAPSRSAFIQHENIGNLHQAGFHASARRRPCPGPAPRACNPPAARFQFRPAPRRPSRSV